MTALPPPTSAVTSGSSEASAERIAGTTSRPEASNGSPARITLSCCTSPSVDVGPGLTSATPSTPSSALVAAATSALVTGPPPLSISTVVGSSTPAGKDPLMTLKPSTLSVLFLNTVVVE